jgi:predicted phage tail protein
VALPTVAFLLGLLLVAVVPGCRCDEGAGCGGCGPNGLVALLLFGGFVSAIVAFMFVLPASLALAYVASMLSKRSK